MKKIPAPVGGLNFLTADNRMSETDAKVLDNWIPDTGYCRVRESGSEAVDFTTAFDSASYLCSAIPALGETLGAWWPMDDPQLGSVTPAVWRQNGTGALTLTPNDGVGLAWNTSVHNTWTVTGESLDIDICNTSAEYVAISYDTLTDWSELGGFTASAQFEVHYVSYIVTTTEALDFVLEYIIDFQRSGSTNLPMNPRLTIGRDVANTRFDFTSSIDGATPSVSVDWNTDYDVHVITIEVPKHGFSDNGNGTWSFDPAYKIYVDDSAVTEFTPTSLDYSATSMTFTGYDTIRLFRGGNATFLGVALHTGSNPHSDLWNAVVRSYQ